MNAGVPGLSRSRAYKSDPCGRGGAESFWNSFGHGLRLWCLSQFQLSFPAASRRVPAPSGNVRSKPWHTSRMEFGSAHTKNLLDDQDRLHKPEAHHLGLYNSYLAVRFFYIEKLLWQ